jgi:fatty-acyl-CoA synthase
MLEAHFGVPWAGGILNTLNTRLSPQEIAYIVDHVSSKILIVDAELLTPATEALAHVAGRRPQVIVCGGPPGGSFEELLENSPPVLLPIEDEYSVLSINYTSGTTGRPKGVKSLSPRRLPAGPRDDEPRTA